MLINDYNNGLLAELCEVIAILDKEHQDLVCHYLVEPMTVHNRHGDDMMLIDTTKEQYASHFKLLLDLLQEFICKRLLSRSPSSTQGSSGFSPNSDPAVIDATKCIAVLCKCIALLVCTKTNCHWLG